MLESVKRNLERFSFDVNEKNILRAMSYVDRENFVLGGYEKYAYVDHALPIGKGQTISQPSTVARMLQLLALKKGDSVLEIGTGSGWNASLIGFLVEKSKVLTLELVPELAEEARGSIKLSRIRNVKVLEEDFRKIKEKFDKIIFTAGILKEQENLIENYAEVHLNEGGILVFPFQAGPIVVLRKQKESILNKYTDEEYAFVPLVIN